MNFKNKNKLIFIIIIPIIFSLLYGSIKSVNNYTKMDNSVSIVLHQTEVSLDFLSIESITPYQVNIQWDIGGNYYKVEVYRKFIDKNYLIAVVDTKTNKFTDNVDYGTYYGYYIKILDQESNILLTSSTLYITTPVDLSDLGAPSYDWTAYKNQKYPEYPLDYLNFTQGDHDIYNYTMHGVNVIVAINKAISSSYKKQAFANNEFRFFNRHWYKFKAFPVKEYRIILEPDGSIYSENELGLLYPPTEIIDQLNGIKEKQAHEIGHAWIGGIINVQNNNGGTGFDYMNEDSDKWILEGFAHLYGVLCLDESAILTFFNGKNFPYYGNMIVYGTDMPLVDLPVYFQTSNAYTYYCKGSIFALYLHKKLYSATSLTLNNFMQYLIRVYNITTQTERYDLNKLISTQDLLQELNDFSGMDFTQDFTDYVYGTVRIPVYSVQLDDIAPLILTNEYVETKYLISDDAIPSYDLIIITSIILVLPLIIALITRKKLKKRNI